MRFTIKNKIKLNLRMLNSDTPQSFIGKPTDSLQFVMKKKAGINGNT